MITVAAQYRFAPGEAGLGVLAGNWGPAHDDGVDSLGKTASLTLPVPAHAGELMLELELSPVLTHFHARKNTIELRANRQTLAARRLGGHCRWRIAIPPAAIAQNHLTCTLAFTESQDNVRQFRLFAASLLCVTPQPLPTPAHEIRDFALGWNQTTEALLGEGFGTPEDAYSWAHGRRSSLHLPVGASDDLVIIELIPYVPAGAPARQRVILGADESLLGIADIRDHVSLAYRLPRRENRRIVDLSFDNLDAAYETNDPLFHFGTPFACKLLALHLTACPPAATPAWLPPVPGNLGDFSLQTAITSRTGLTAAELAGKFENLGNRCGIARAQRLMGHTHHGLLCFASCCQPVLLRAILDGFSSFTDTTTYRWQAPTIADGNFLLYFGNESLNIATPYTAATAPAAGSDRRIARILARQTETLMAKMSDGETIFVLRIAEPFPAATAMAAALAVWAALRKWGNARMLWLVYSEDKPPGSAERLENGLIRGYLSPQRHLFESPDSIASVFANGWMLAQAPAGKIANS